MIQLTQRERDGLVEVFWMVLLATPFMRHVAATDQHSKRLTSSCPERSFRSLAGKGKFEVIPVYKKIANCRFHPLIHDNNAHARDFPAPAVPACPLH